MLSFKNKGPIIAVPGFSIAGPSTTPRKRQVRFSARHDILLLREVIAQNPFISKESGRIWARVGEIVTAALQDENFEVDGRRCRERTMLLLDYYKKQDFPSLRRFARIGFRLNHIRWCDYRLPPQIIVIPSSPFFDYFFITA